MLVFTQMPIFVDSLKLLLEWITSSFWNLGALKNPQFCSSQLYANP